ncbi:DUF423 domain-containing protein [Algibacter amylolyticus]|uniref:DUF423 domain-containing protein n=1 Tax=Algibacter amylolyticus TaxID=1608400 RepID=A0A5M7BHU8_9FLAO|nr:DUF423 domain-containing protein [Algibacter amylolyticus]KAA5827908.1 DUF423 domain-containing protein [Algibacter amylolyticus]MBB5267141.1 uncharacterized membrane protein YgdD (TMEM256/DUF423 family) [Algibacter amylolyticus]TSJ82153.1 DUF423 domain-containing protein [Algibacter amylolyticus]
MNKTILVTGAILGVLSIILGAFGAHALKELIPETAQQTFETGVRYQMYHALFLLFIGHSPLIKEKTKRIIFFLVVIGVLFFSGSIYGLATNCLSGFNFKSIGFITPIGGLLLIMAWCFMLGSFLNFSSKKVG